MDIADELRGQLLTVGNEAAKQALENRNLRAENEALGKAASKFLTVAGFEGHIVSRAMCEAALELRRALQETHGEPSS